MCNHFLEGRHAPNGVRSSWTRPGRRDPSQGWAGGPVRGSGCGASGRHPSCRRPRASDRCRLDQHLSEFERLRTTADAGDKRARWCERNDLLQGRSLDLFAEVRDADQEGDQREPEQYSMSCSWKSLRVHSSDPPTRSPVGRLDDPKAREYTSCESNHELIFRLGSSIAKGPTP